jgi:hypothetical protein
VHCQTRLPLRALGLVIGAALFGVTVGAAPAVAKPGPAAPAAAPNGHCVVGLTPGSDKAASTNCFASFSEAISFATGGAVTDTPTNSAEMSALTTKVNAANAAAPPSVQAVISVEWFGLGFTGTSITFSGPVNCTTPTSNIDYQITLASVDWDQISSFQSFSNCWVDHYFLQNFGLPRTGYFPTRSPVSTMNVGGGPFNGDNNTRSIRWS